MEKTKIFPNWFLLIMGCVGILMSLYLFEPVRYFANLQHDACYHEKYNIDTCLSFIIISLILDGSLIGLCLVSLGIVCNIIYVYTCFAIKYLFQKLINLWNPR